MCKDLSRTSAGEFIYTDDVQEEHVIPVMHVGETIFHLNKERPIAAIKKIFGGVNGNTVSIKSNNEEAVFDTEDEEEYSELIMDHITTQTAPFRPNIHITDSENNDIKLRDIKIVAGFSPQYYRYGRDGTWYGSVTFNPSQDHDYLYQLGMGGDEDSDTFFSDYDGLFSRRFRENNGLFEFYITDAMKNICDGDSNAEVSQLEAADLNRLNEILGIDSEGLYVRINVDTCLTYIDPDEGNDEVAGSISILKVFLDPTTQHLMSDEDEHNEEEAPGGNDVVEEDLINQEEETSSEEEALDWADMVEEDLRKQEEEARNEEKTMDWADMVEEDLRKQEEEASSEEETLDWADMVEEDLRKQEEEARNEEETLDWADMVEEDLRKQEEEARKL
ncbi:hypothetical protein H4219_001457 [Mycoemilia scoparia]|uniref:Uncharacterized protein n=1 Tax=Mycoemilia scoparia TaxID=417184 RepID=A0A9W8A0Y3_9FUNG|nr:hypothetical protein H4219_001457 [Mycoemilia scoparia]